MTVPAHGTVFCLDGLHPVKNTGKSTGAHFKGGEPLQTAYL